MCNCCSLQGSLSVGQGERGKSLEFTWEGTSLGVRVEGDLEYQFVDLGAEDGSGKEVQLQVSNGYIQWKYADEEEWKNLIAISELKGDTGLDGKSAYELWLENGNEGTLDDFLSSLKGKDGEQGDKGDTGEQGLPGQDGADGKDGITPNISIGTVTTLEPGQQATVTIRGDNENPVFDFEIPKGQDGEGSGSEAIERLIVSYTHEAGTVINVTDLDTSTGIFTTDTNISSYSGTITVVKNEGINYLTKDDIPKELQGMSSNKITVLTENTFKVGTISSYSNLGNLSKYGFIVNGASVNLKNAFEPNKRYKMRIESESPAYNSGMPLNQCVNAFNSAGGVVIGSSQYNSYLGILDTNSSYAINGYVIDIILDNYEDSFDLDVKICASGIYNNSEQHTFKNYKYKYVGNPMVHFAYSQYRNVLPKGTTIKIWEVA